MSANDNVTIRDIRTIMTEPENIRLVIVKIETSEPGLYGVGCATFTQRPSTVKAAVDDYLRPFLLGKNVADIEDIWQSSYVSSYWRNGPVLNNALSGVDQALWDIKGKMAGMPVYDLLGGRAREAAPVYVHASGASKEETADKMQALMEQGFHHIRVQVATRGYSSYGSHGASGDGSVNARDVSQGPIAATTWLREYDPDQLYAHPGGVFEPKPYIRGALDLFSPEDNEYFRMVRQQCATPIAMGELWNSPHEIIPMIKDRLVDFLRMHMSQVGGITPGKKFAAMGELFSVRTAWHGPRRHFTSRSRREPYARRQLPQLRYSGIRNSGRTHA